MNKLTQIALALSVLSLAACSKSADKAVEALNAIPAPAPGAGPAAKPTAPSVVKWSGPGSMQMTGMPETACATVTAEILDDANGFELQKFSYDCSGTSANMDTIRLDVRAGDLYLGTEKVGQKKDNTVEFELHDPSGATLAFQFVSANDTLQVKHSMKANGFEQNLTATLKH